MLQLSERICKPMFKTIGMIGMIEAKTDLHLHSHKVWASIWSSTQVYDIAIIRLWLTQCWLIMDNEGDIIEVWRGNRLHDLTKCQFTSFVAETTYPIYLYMYVSLETIKIMHFNKHVSTQRNNAMKTLNFLRA